MQFSDVIFCDDVRYEMNNKLSLMGVYNDKLILHFNNENEVKWPISFKLSIVLRFKFNINDKLPDKFQFEYFLNSRNIIQQNGMLSLKSDQTHLDLVLNVEGLPLELGNLGFLIKLFKEDTLLLSEERKHALRILKG